MTRAERSTAMPKEGDTQLLNCPSKKCKGEFRTHILLKGGIFDPKPYYWKCTACGHVIGTYIEKDK